jgi:hypothetical protein
MSERPLGSKISARRRWAIRTTLMLFLTAVVLCLLVIWVRDRNTVSASLRVLDPPIKALRDRVSALGVLPAVLPESKLQLYYASPAERFYAMNSREPVIIAATLKISLLLRENGRCVIIYEKGAVHSEWIPESRFLSQWDEQRKRIEDFQAKIRSRPPELP